MQPQSSESSPYDAIVVGGGICGALVALKLSRAGKRVLVLEAGTGEAMDPDKYDSYVSKYHAMGGLRSTPNGPYPVNLSALSPNDANRNPYFVQEGQQRFLSDYLRMLGGSTLHWQGTTVRMLPSDFRMQSEYGQGSDWPISYDDLEAYYREAEREIGVSANVEEQRNFGVWFPDGYVYPMEKMPQSLIDQFFMEALVGANVGLYGGQYPLRVVSLPMARNSKPNLAYDGRRGYKPVGAVGDPESGLRCHGNSSCSPLCPVQAKYSAMKTLHQAQNSGRVEVRTQCVASKLRIDTASGRIQGVEYKRYAIRGQAAHVNEFAQGAIVILAANAIENTTLMLASGVVDRSGQLGRNLMDHPYISFQGLAPSQVFPFRGPDVTSGIESLRDGKFREKHASFRASIGNWGWVGEPTGSVSRLLSQLKFGGDFRRQLREKLTRMVRLGVFLEQLPEAHNRVTIDPEKRDLLGNYLPIVNYSYGDYALDGAIAAIEAVWPAVVEKAGIQDETDFTTAPSGFQAVTHRGRTFNVMGPGHIVGTHRMGRSPNASVVNSNLQSWAHPNLYAVGSGSMVTIGTANPTLTAAALSLRVVDHILSEQKQTTTAIQVRTPSAMNASELDKETYRGMIDAYFRAFGTRDFSQVRFSSQIEFLSPISGITLKGRTAVVNFVSGVSTRVSCVNVLSIAVDYPTASGVWQMTTTKGVKYTLHNFFRLDGEGIAYVWPMFDPKSVINDPPGLLEWLRGEGYYDVAATVPKQLTGVTISKAGRIFVNFPRWVDEPTPSVGEIGPDGSVVPYPNQEMNEWDKSPGESAQNHFVCVQNLVADKDDFLWILDPASPAHDGAVEGGPKLVKVNLKTDQVERTYPFDREIAPAGSYLNDVRFARGFAFITDSDLGAIVVLNLTTSMARRLLVDHPSTKSEPGVQPVIEGRPYEFPPIHADGIAIDPKHEYLYYKALTGRTLYRIAIAALLTESLSADLLGRHVEHVAVLEPSGGLEFDADGNLYVAAFEANAIKVLRPDGRFEFFARATDFLWPDTMTTNYDGELLFSASQAYLMPNFNGGVDKRTPPYKVFRLKLK
jgi:choline dehydrogenase-like flavoprotein/sugar lactone lactonase YvrE